MGEAVRDKLPVIFTEELLPLLWKAYPRGFLMARGVSTIGGYLCWGNGYWCNPVNAGSPGHARAPFFALWPAGGDELLIKAGLFLPHLDPAANPATWTAAKQEMATTLKMIHAGGENRRRTELVWARSRSGTWRLGAVTSDATDQEAGLCPSRPFRGIADERPVQAFLIARASLHQDGTL